MDRLLRELPVLEAPVRSGRFADCQFGTSHIEQVLQGYFDVNIRLALFMDWQTGHFGLLRELYFVPTH